MSLHLPSRCEGRGIKPGVLVEYCSFFFYFFFFRGRPHGIKDVWFFVINNISVNARGCTVLPHFLKKSKNSDKFGQEIQIFDKKVLFLDKLYEISDKNLKCQ